MKQLFICAIGPVQDFIASARRSRDLWYGSWMLSELSKSAAGAIAEKYGVASLIFPAVDSVAMLKPATAINAPNKIIALVTFANDDSPDKLGELVRKAIFTRLSELQDDAFTRLKESEFNLELALVQILDLPEIYWVSMPYGTDDNYEIVRDQAEALLAARKNTRNFQKIQGDYQPKSSLDGARESVIPENDYPQGSNDPQRIKKIKILYDRFRARQGERLSGVDLLKRLGGTNVEPNFYSTSHMAALPFLERVEALGKGTRKKLLEEIARTLKVAGWEVDERDGALVFESRLVDLVPAGTELEELRKELGKILKEYSGEWSSKLSPYYALLAADGDNMGKTIDAQTDPAKHQKMSQLLSKFAQAVPDIIRKYKGVPIYAGGDDVLAYLPLHTVLACAKELAERFSAAMAEFAFEDQGTKISPTLSTGIVIAHHLTPLSDVLELARKAEKQAKKVTGKNGLAITLSKRGGVDRTIYGKWGKLDGRLDQLINLTRHDAISSGTAYELQQLDRDLSGTSIPMSGIVVEAIRIIKRKRESGSEKRIDQDIIQLFQQWLAVDNVGTSPEVTLPELAQEMMVAKIFADAADLANSPMQAIKEEIQ